MFKRYVLTYFVLCFLLSATHSAHAENVRIAAAADLKFALDEIVIAFKNTLPSNTNAERHESQKIKIDVIYGSSGKFHTQLVQGAPYDIYFSADIRYPEALAKLDLVAGEVMPYAIGRIVLWRIKTQQHQALTFDSMMSAETKHIAIANPVHAPYGVRAKEALIYMKLWESLASKLVLGENIAQATQFVETGNADIGIIALSLALSPKLQDVGEYYLIPEEIHSPLLQGFVLTKRASKNATAQAFVKFMSSQTARTIMAKYGFTQP